jgi:hypothetical protein
MRLAALTLALLFAVGAAAQDAPVPGPRAQADAARKAATDANARLQALQAEAAQLEKEASTLEAEAAAAEAQAAEPAPDPEHERLEKMAKDADERAQDAQQRAEEAIQELEAFKKQFAYDRTGLYFGGSLFWAPEVFDTSLSVSDGLGASGRIGYRFHRRIGADVRFDWIDDFDLSGDGYEAKLRPWAITGNVKFYILTRRIQPWLGLGLGAFSGTLKGNDAGESFSVTRTAAVLRPSAGIDLYLTPNFVLQGEAAFNAVGGDFSRVNYGQLGAGLDFRF